MEEIDYEKLDPGIRKLVKLLRDNGFDTTDSGDGISKFTDFPDSCAESMPNVYIQTTSDILLSECNRLVNLLKQHVKSGTLEETFIHPDLGQEVSRVAIEATYLPMEEVSVLGVHGIADIDLIDLSTSN